MQRFISRIFFKVLLVALFFLIIVLINPVGIVSPVRSGLLVVLNPFQKFFYTISVSIENTKDFIGSIGQLKKENEQLIKDKQNLLAENTRLQDVENENTLLRNQLNLLPRDQYNLIASFVISQDPNGMGNWLEIDKGTADGIENGMPVIVSNGILIGRIGEANAHDSKVILLTNPQSTINIATLQNGTKGVAKGEYGLGIIFDMILQTDAINVGNDVITSGVGGDIPKGLYVGTVQEIHSSDDHLFQQAVVNSPVQSSKLQAVFVIKNSKK